MKGTFFKTIKKAVSMTKNNSSFSKQIKSVGSYIAKPSSKNGVYDIGMKGGSLVMGGVVVSNLANTRGSEEALQRVAKLKRVSEFAQQIDRRVY